MRKPDLKDLCLARLHGDALIAFVESLGHQARRIGGEHKIVCPFHDDSKPSLAINTVKREGGIFKCFACDWGAGDVFDFVGALHGISDKKDFRGKLKLVAQLLGIVEGSPLDTVAPQQREGIKPKSAYETMQPGEVLDELRWYRERALPVAPWAEALGVDPRAIDLCGMVVAPYRHNTERTVLVAPMRREDGTLCSLRFRDFETRKRWSLDVKERQDDGSLVQVKASASGLMAISNDDFCMFDADICREFSIGLVIEGETDLLGGVTIMLRSCGADPFEWPLRITGLPGVNTCHETLLEAPLAGLTVTMFDRDNAGLRAVFNHFQRRKVPLPAGGFKMELEMDKPKREGLLAKMSAAGHKARASFPPEQADGSKYDVRDMARGGWDWERLRLHLLTNSTADPHGHRFVQGAL